MKRFDVSYVPLQGAYIAKRCPVRAQNDVLVPCAPTAPSQELQRRFDRGKQFDETVVSEIVEVRGGTLVAAGETIEDVVASTLEAMAGRVPVILGGRLPADIVGRRVGKPDLLVLATDGGYRPVDVKHHMALEPIRTDRNGMPALCASLDTPGLEEGEIDERFSARKREDDLLQLAHYQRILEAAGLAASDGRWGGIIGVEGRVVWYDLDAAIWRTPSSTGQQKLRTTMERYDFEFDFRLDVMAVAYQHKQDPTVDLRVVPVRVSECGECPWWDHCRPQLESGSGDVSLLPRIGWREWKIHFDHGVRDRAALAALDVRTAGLVTAGVNVAEMQRLIEDLPPETSVKDLGVVVRAKTQLARLEAEDVRTFGDLASLCSVTASYYGSGLSGLPTQIDLARAALGASPIYRRRGVDALSVPRGDIEVDVDMENIEEGVYLWGALVTDRTSTERTSMYHSFVTWEGLSAAEEARNFVLFWDWLSTIRRQAAEAGHSFRAYCYNASAENTYLRKLGLQAGILDEATGFIQSGEWVDLLRVVDDQLMTGTGSGLKAIAPITGFSWDIDDPGGGISMVQYDVAVGMEDTVERRDAREWLLTYNRGDVEATLAIRDWLEAVGSALPSITSLEPWHATEESRSFPVGAP